MRIGKMTLVEIQLAPLGLEYQFGAPATYARAGGFERLQFYDMEWRTIMPVLKVSDFETSVKFYQEVLGFTLTWRSQDTAALESGGAALMLSTGDHLGPGKPTFTGTLYFETPGGVRDLWARLQSKAPVVWPLSEMDYGTLEFGIRDPDGYTLAFSEDRA